VETFTALRAHYTEIFTGCRARLCSAATILALCGYNWIETLAARMGRLCGGIHSVQGATMWRHSLCAGLYCLPASPCTSCGPKRWVLCRCVGDSSSPRPKLGSFCNSCRTPSAELYPAQCSVRRKTPSPASSFSGAAFVAAPPGPPPFSSINSTPADSKAERILMPVSSLPPSGPS
jgi:hypothetical protein